MAPKQLILSSTSQPRRLLLERLLLPFAIADPQVDETPRAGELAKHMVQRLAEEKAKAVASQYPHAIIIGADQVGTLGEHILGKPMTHQNAVKQLEQMSAQTVRFFTGMCVFDAENQRSLISLDVTEVIFRTLTHDMIENYLRIEQPYQCAGSTRIEGLGISLVREVQGKDFTALIGLPLITLTQMLEQVGAGPLRE
ncbi:MAG: Maf family protein [Gammaproteobacteria bacterium]